jgi:hypothetical protein
MSAKAKLLPLVAVTCCVFSTACTNWAARSTQENGTTQQNVPHPQRYVPVGNNPEIALDTETGMLCRTVADANDSLGILDPSCAVDPEQKKLGFIPIACKSGKTWVRGEGDTSPSRYTKLPTCGGVSPQSAPSEQQNVAPTPQTHVFSVSKYKAANPKGDVNAAVAAAKAAGYSIVP